MLTMPDEPGSWLSLLQQHLTWYPLMEPRDIYKLLYQGVMGSEHLITSPAEFINGLRLEFGRLLPDPHERLLELVRPDQTLLRLNLRAYKSRSPLPDPLISAILETGRTFAGAPDELRVAWTDFVGYCQQGLLLSFAIRDVQHFSRWLASVECPAVHHSELYRREYQPAYRLISADFLPDLGLEHAG